MWHRLSLTVDADETARRKADKLAKMSPKELIEYKRKGEEFKRNLSKNNKGIL